MPQSPNASVISLAAALLLSVTASPVLAGLIAYDGFETVAGSPASGQYDSMAGTPAGVLKGQSPAMTGFAAATAWVGSDHAYRYTKAVTTGLGYSSLPTLDGSIVSARYYDSNDNYNSYYYRNSNTGATIAEGDVTRWISFLIEPNLAADTNTNPEADPYIVTLTFGRVGGLTFTLDNTPTLTVAAPDSNSGSESVALVEDQTHLIVAKLEHFNGVYGAGSENITFWLDPDVTAGEYGLGAGATIDGIVLNASDALSDLVDFSRLRIDQNLNMIGGVGQSVAFDEFRVGTTAADVGIVPEPSVWVLLAFGLPLLTGCARSRRRTGLATKAD